jgi:hypothetical protein
MKACLLLQDNPAMVSIIVEAMTRVARARNNRALLTAVMNILHTVGPHLFLPRHPFHTHPKMRVVSPCPHLCSPNPLVTMSDLLTLLMSLLRWSTDSANPATMCANLFRMCSDLGFLIPLLYLHCYASCFVFLSAEYPSIETVMVIRNGMRSHGARRQSCPWFHFLCCSMFFLSYLNISREMNNTGLRT